MGLAGKRIFIISPQHWQSVKISKQHYAITLSKFGSKVFFINPIIFDFSFRTEIESYNSNLNIISLYIPIPKIVKFRLKGLFHIFNTLFFKYLINQFRYPDILWNFDNELYFKHEKLFSKSLKIFHPVDMFPKEKLRDYQTLYDFVFSPSLDLLNIVSHTKKQFINHGLNDIFVKLSKSEVYRDMSSSKTVSTIGYLGNLSIPVLNRNAFINIISHFPNITFKLIGELNNQCEFQRTLTNYKNVEFVGRKEGENLYHELISCDLLIVCYLFKENVYHSDNTHKILEYLSTGKPIISSPLKVYEDCQDLITFIDFENEDYISKIYDTINNYGFYYSEEKRKKRIKLALSNSYQKQIERIKNIINTGV